MKMPALLLLSLALPTPSFALEGGCATDSHTPPAALTEIATALGYVSSDPLAGVPDGTFQIPARFLDSAKTFVVRKAGDVTTVSVGFGHHPAYAATVLPDGSFFLPDPNRGVRFPRITWELSGTIHVEGGALVFRATETYVSLDRSNETGEIRGVLFRKRSDWRGSVPAVPVVD